MSLNLAQYVALLICIIYTTNILDQDALLHRASYQKVQRAQRAF